MTSREYQQSELICSRVVFEVERTTVRSLYYLNTWNKLYFTAYCSNGFHHKQ